MPKPSHDIALIAPAMESLFDRDMSSLWPKEILEDPALIGQAGIRQKLYSRLRSLFPQMKGALDVTYLYEKGVVRAEELAEIYELLARFLEADPYHRRLILYLPFELLPPKCWSRDADGLQGASDAFTESYMRSWRALFEEIDVRANFVDGDILEPELAPQGQEMVQKAAHLAPKLVEKSLLSKEEVQALFDNTSEPLLRRALREALEAITLPPLKASEETVGAEWIRQLPEIIAYELKKFDMREATDYARGMPPLRVAWERRHREDEFASFCAQQIAQALVLKKALWSDVRPLVSKKNHITVGIAAIRGVRDAAVELAKSDPSRSAELADEIIRTNLTRERVVRDEFETLISYWKFAGIVSEGEQKMFGFEPARLDGKFSKESSLAVDLRSFKATIDFMANDPECRRLFYPVAIFFGSRLKGYAKGNADLDAAVFVRPGVKKSERKNIRSILAALFSKKNVGGKVVEYWLRETRSGLAIRDFPNPDVFLADSTWAHLALSSVWLGKKDALGELYEKLLPGFLFSTGKTFMGVDMRRLSLGEMEREVLQYRLMHKGYRRFFPPTGGIDKRASGLDPESVFWDSGYRALATELFISRVFLPRLMTKRNGQ